VKKRYVVLVDSATKEQEAAFVEFMKSQKFGFWHWLSNSWLLVDNSGVSSATAIRDKVDEVFPGAYNLVLELAGGTDTWAGFGPQSDKRDMFKWIKDYWKESS
jgi:hypothetical protein